MIPTPDTVSAARLAVPTDHDAEAATADEAVIAGTPIAAGTPAAAVAADSAVPAVTATAVGADAGTAASITEALDTEQAKPLWEALIQARSTSPVISAAEDAVFRFYLPLARTTARTYAGWAVDPDLAEQAAELGLANAVLAWRRADICAFAAFARAAMLRQISTANARGRRLRQPVPATAADGNSRE